MKKKLFILMVTTFLAGCVLAPQEEKNSTNVNTEVRVLSPDKVQMQLEETDDEFLTIPEVPVKKVEMMPYMEVLAKKLRKGLRSTGVKVTQVESQVDLIIPNKMIFGTNQSKIQASAEDSLTLIAQLLSEYDKTMIQIIGYTDNVGSVLKNKEQSLHKADMLADFLIQKGINAERIITDGAGGDNPVANNATLTGREQNRRIEITLISLQ
ncbi:MAG: OmpA family protein [Alphaproteobacteria bacterium]|nr:OmpA family protein [Alphaproteobacteria bacterium]